MLRKYAARLGDLFATAEAVRALVDVADSETRVVHDPAQDCYAVPDGGRAVRVRARSETASEVDSGPGDPAPADA